MALLVDGNISSLVDLQAYDSGVLEAARNEGVNVEQKLALAEEEISLEVAAFLLRHKERAPLLPNGQPDLRPVVVSSGLRLWSTLRTLALIYGDAYSSQLNDRYLNKQRHFETHAKKAADTYFETGVGLTYDPILRARPPELVTGGAGPEAAVYSLSVAWRSTRGGRGAASLPITITTTAGQGFQVRAVDPPDNSMSFDVYAASNEQAMTQQTQFPVPAGEWWVMPPTGLVTGASISLTQSADYFVRHQRILRRG
jgi:hypothetical protein